MRKWQDPEERRRALEVALRRNKWARMLPERVARLSAIGVPVTPDEFLSPDETDAIVQGLASSFYRSSAVCRDRWQADEYPEIVGLLDELANRVGPVSVLWVYPSGDLPTAVPVPADALLRSPPPASRLVYEDWLLMSRDLQHGVWLEYDRYDDAGHYDRDGFYDLRRWGVLLHSLEFRRRMRSHSG